MRRFLELMTGEYGRYVVQQCFNTFKPKENEVDMDMEDGDSAAEPSTSDQGNTENVVLAATYITFDDPVRDLEVISQELRLKDIEFMEKRIEELEKSMKRSNGKQLKIEHELCLKVCFLLDWNDFFFFLNLLYIFPVYISTSYQCILNIFLQLYYYIVRRL
nr:obg-like ATPase 1 [Ipomoea batatas]